ncbi:MAG: SAM-dependent methyltransferase [Carbonactinosporaceae bacterium]
MADDQKAPPPSGLDTTGPSPARVYDYILGGKDNFAIDREAAQKILAAAPDTGALALANREFLVRAVRFMAQSGICQFIDVGTGIPTSPSVHEVARSFDPSARVVYVDNDPMVVVHNRARLATDDGIEAIDGDVRDAEGILSDPQLHDLIDYDEPVGVLVIAVLHFISDEEDPAGALARFRDRMAPGSYLVIAQMTADGDPEGLEQARAAGASAGTNPTFRSREELLSFFEGFELVAPGLVDVQHWRPEHDAAPTRLKVAGGVGRRI